MFSSADFRKMARIKCLRNITTLFLLLTEKRNRKNKNLSFYIYSCTCAHICCLLLVYRQIYYYACCIFPEGINYALLSAHIWHIKPYQKVGRKFQLVSKNRWQRMIPVFQFEKTVLRELKEPCERQKLIVLYRY